MTFRLTYEITHDQGVSREGAGVTAGRIIRIDLECEPASEDETREAVSAFLTAATGEREALRRDTRWTQECEEFGCHGQETGQP